MASDRDLGEQPPVEAYRLLRLIARPRAAVRRRLRLVWRRRLAVLLGGCAGTALRLAVGVVPHQPGSWPWTTLVVNLTGALALGYLLTRFVHAAAPTVLTIPLLCTGLLGSYTTFSALSAESWQLLADGHPRLAGAYAATSIAAGYLLALVGIRLAERRP